MRGLRYRFLKLLFVFTICFAVTFPLSEAFFDIPRTLNIVHMHTKERLTVTFKREGRYDKTALDKLNWLLRDWRRDEPTKMDPRLFDLLWEVTRETGTNEPIHVVSAYRSPQTNDDLRSRSRGVAKYSQHTMGRAMDFYLPDVSVAKIRMMAAKKQLGGVGYYPTSGHPFVHLDVGSVRAWPRLTRDQLYALFPDGKTVHLPADGKALEGYEEAVERIGKDGKNGPARVAEYGDQTVRGLVNGNSGFISRSKNLFAALFGGGNEEDESEGEPIPSIVAENKQIAQIKIAEKLNDEEVPAKAVQNKSGILVSSAIPSSSVIPVPPTRQATGAPLELPSGQFAKQSEPITQIKIASNGVPIPTPRFVWVTGPSSTEKPVLIAANTSSQKLSPIVAGKPIPKARPTQNIQVANVQNLNLNNSKPQPTQPEAAQIISPESPKLTWNVGEQSTTLANISNSQKPKTKGDKGQFRQKPIAQNLTPQALLASRPIDQQDEIQQFSPISTVDKKTTQSFR